MNFYPGIGVMLTLSGFRLGFNYFICLLIMCVCACARAHTRARVCLQPTPKPQHMVEGQRTTFKNQFSLSTTQVQLRAPVVLPENPGLIPSTTQQAAHNHLSLQLERIQHPLLAADSRQGSCCTDRHSGKNTHNVKLFLKKIK